ncbi:MAG: ATP-dependent helicase [Ardenticatenaceae bacterium]
MAEIELLKTLNEKQQQAVMSEATCTIVLAGPGSGKTRTLTYRIAYLIEKMGVHPAKILAVTFTNKAAREMQERLMGLLDPSQAKKVNARTFHSWGARMLRYDMPHVVPILKKKFFSTKDKQELNIHLPEDGLSSDFSIYDTTEQTNLMKDIINKLNLDFDPKDVLRTVSGLKNLNVRPDSAKLLSLAEEEVHINLLRNCYVLYQAALFRHNACDFDDLILLPLLLFEGDSKKLWNYQEMTSYFLIDEFQDTNEVQYKLSVLLAERGNIFVVGDEDQAIYGFRFADFKNVTRLMSAYPKHNLILLEQNYRSNPGIVNAANSLISNNTERVDKKLWTNNSGESQITTFIAQDQVDEAHYVASIVEFLQKDGHSYDEIAILYRVNAQTRAIETGLLKKRIAYRLMQGTAFFERREVRDALAYLKFIRNGDLYAFMRIIDTRFGLGKKSAQAIIAAPQEEDLTAWLQMRYQGKKENEKQDSASGKSVLSWLKNFYQQGKPLKESGIPSEWKKLAKRENLKLSGGSAKNVWLLAEEIATLCEKVPDLSTIELIGEVIKILKPYIIKKFKEPAERLENVCELLTVAVGMEGHGEEGLVMFLDEIALATDVEKPNEDENSTQEQVTLSTMHRSKGLEWDNVLMTGVEENLSPYYKASTEAQHEEERRLFYVGFTRARKNVYLLRTKERTLFGKTRSNAASPYLDELGIID